MKGYLKNKSSTEKAFAGGWFHTGDLGVMHPDGYIQLKDRSKDIIISGGENISSIEVEDALYKHPAVAAAAVVAKPDDKWGETPCAFIELKPDTKASADELMQWCRKHLASYKCPRYVVFAEIPKTSTGKIQKFKLREMAKARISHQACVHFVIALRLVYPRIGQEIHLISNSFVRHLKESMPDILISNEGPVRKVRMNRPEKKNALTLAMYETMASAIEDAGAAGSVKCLIIAGTPDIFCAGNDLNDFVTMAEGWQPRHPDCPVPPCTGAL